MAKKPTYKELEQEIEGMQTTIIRQGAILRGVCRALRGKHPNPLATYGVHDMAVWAKKRMAELRKARAELKVFKDEKAKRLREYT